MSEPVDFKVTQGSRFMAYPIRFDLHQDHDSCQCPGCRAFHDPRMQEAFTELRQVATKVFMAHGLDVPEGKVPEGFLDGKS